MKEELLKEFKNEYKRNLDDLQNANRNLEILKKRKEILENSALVKDYIELTKQIDRYMNSNDDENSIFSNLLSGFKSKGLVDKTNEILCYTGTYFNENGIVRRVYRDNPIGEYDIYVDIESMDEIEVPIEDRNIFENSHKIIPLEGIEPTRLFLDKLSNQFIMDALDEGQETACKKILSRKKKNL